MKRKLFFLLCALLTMIGVQAETDYTNLMPSTWTGQTGGFQGGSEHYQGTTITGDKVLYQSFTAPATGIYEIKFYAVTSSTAERDGGVEKIYGPNIAQAYATAGENKAVVGMDVIAQTGCTLVQDANIRTLSVEATEGETIEYGLENIAKGGNWYTIKALSAKMKTVAEIFQAQYDEAYAIWENSTENEVGARATFKTYVDALNTAMSGSLADAQTASDNLAAQLVIYESKSYPVKGSGVKYDFTSKMNMAINAWTCKQGNGPAQYGFTGATETYKGSAYAVGEVMYQTISGLASGEYEIHFYAVANSPRSESASGPNIAYVYANDQITDIDVIAQDGCTPSEYERTITVMVSDGTIKYGISNKAAGGNWYVAKNVALYMTGAPDLSDYYEAIAVKLIAANGLKSSPMNSAVLADLQDAIDATEGYTDITVISTLETMSANLTTAINNANTSISNYEEALSVLNAASNLDAAGQAYYATNETVAGIRSAYDARTLVAVTPEQKAACIAVLPEATRQQTSDNTDWTAVIVNPSFETGNFTGWTNTGSMATQNNTSFSLKDGTYYAEFWQPNGTKGVSQTVTDLPAGVYRITAKAYARTVTSAKLFADRSETAVVDADTYTVDCTLLEDGDLTFGFQAVGTGADASWICVDNFTLEFLHAPTAADYKVVLNNAITTATDARKSANEGTGVFQIPAAAGTTLAGAITDAQNVYDNTEATISDVTTAISTLYDAVETYEATTLNAPEVGKRYCIVVATEGHAKFGLAVGIALGATSDNNPTGYTINTSNTTNQSVVFTQVSGNSYNINFETAEGTTYLTYGTENGSAAGWKDSQIQATTVTENKGNFTIAATNKANVFNIYNIHTNSTIACQAGGNIYTEAGNADFTLVEATAANMAVNAEAQWGTFCAPFAVAIPSGVTAYTCADATNGVLNLVEVTTTIPANTPVILNAESGLASTTFYGKKVANESEDLIEGGMLRGNVSASAKDITYTGNEYLLQRNGGKTGFYKVNNENTYKVGYNRCYLVMDSNLDAREAFFFFGDDVTAINTIEAAEAENGALKDGKYLIGNKIVLVKNGVKFGANGQKLN